MSNFRPFSSFSGVVCLIFGMRSTNSLQNIVQIFFAGFSAVLENKGT